jgi:ribonuclease HI
MSGMSAAADVIALELALLEPAHRADRDFLERVLHPDFEEVGASGRRWPRDELIDTLLGDPGVHRPGAGEFEANELWPDAILLTYRTPGSRRSSLWLRAGGRWQLRFHQGTPSKSGSD